MKKKNAILLIVSFFLLTLMNFENVSAYTGPDETFETYIPTTEVRNTGGWNNWGKTGGTANGDSFTNNTQIRATTYWNAWTVEASCSFTAVTETGNMRAQLIDNSGSRRINPVMSFGSSSGTIPGRHWLSFDVKAVTGGAEELRLGDSTSQTRIRLVFETNNSINYYTGATLHATGASIVTTAYRTVYIHTVNSTDFYITVSGTKYPTTGSFKNTETFTGAITTMALYTGQAANARCNVYFDNFRPSWYTALSTIEDKYSFTAQTRKGSVRGYFSRTTPGSPASYPLYTFTSAQSANVASVNITVDPIVPTIGDMFIRYKSGSTDVTQFRFQNATAGQNIQVLNNAAWATLAGYTAGTDYVIKTSYLSATTFDIVINSTTYNNGGAHFTKSAGTSSLIDSVSLEQSTGSTGSFYVDNIDASWLGIGPTSTFTVNNTYILEGQFVSFTYTGATGDQTPVSYHWNFGDGSSNSTLENPTHQYLVHGNYTVTLSVVNSAGDTSTTSTASLVDVGNNVVLTSTFSANQTTSVAGHEVTFTHTGSDGNTPTTHQWSFGDGGSNGTTHVATHVYSVAGTYTVILSTKDSTNQFSKTTRAAYITVEAETYPDATFVANETRPADLAYVAFNHTGQKGNIPETYQWDFGDGTANVTTENATHQYLLDGFFTVTLTIVDLDGDFDTFTRVNYVEMGCTVDPDPTFSTNVTSLIAGQSVNFTHTGTNGNDLPNTYQWSFGDGTNSTYENRTHQYNTAGTFTVVLTVIDAHGCTETETMVDLITVLTDLQPEANFTSNVTTLIENQYVAFDRTGFHGNGLGTYDWEFGDLTANSSLHDPIHQYTTAGTYTVTLTVTDIDGDVGTHTEVDYITVLADLLPNATYTVNDTGITAGQSVLFSTVNTTGNLPATFQWEFGDGSPNATSVNTTVHFYTVAGTYTTTLTIIDANGDLDTFSYATDITVLEAALPDASFTSNETLIIAGQYVQFLHTGASGNAPATYKWSFGDLTANSTSENPLHQYSAAGNYTVTLHVVDTDGDKDTHTVVSYIDVMADIVPVATFTANQTTIYLRQYINFTHTGSDGNEPGTRQWSFGDDSFNTTIRGSIVYLYSEAGSYQVNLTVVDADGDVAYYTLPVNITVLANTFPTSFFSANVTTVIEGGWVCFNHTGSSGDGPSTYTWDFGDGNTATTQNATHQYADIGAYNIVFTVTDVNLDFVSRQEVRYITVTWDHASPVIILNDTYCQYFASDGDGSIGDPYIIENFTIDAGAFPAITINNTRHSLVFRNGSIDSTVNATAIINATTVTFTSCIFYYNATFSTDSLGITFTGNTFWNYFTVTGVDNWNFTDGQVMPVAYNGSVNDTGSVYLNSVFGVSTPDVVPVASFHVGNTGTLYTLTLITFHFDGTPGDAIVTYNWTFGDGHSILGSSVWHAYAVRGDYNVTLTITDKDGQNSTYSEILDVHKKPDGSGGGSGGDGGSGDGGSTTPVDQATITTVVSVGAAAGIGFTLLVLSNYFRSAKPVARRGSPASRGRQQVKRKNRVQTRARH